MSCLCMCDHPWLESLEMTCEIVALPDDLCMSQSVRLSLLYQVDTLSSSLYTLSGLGMPLDTPGRAEKCFWGEGRLESPA